jgi:hypothetical protein
VKISKHYKPELCIDARSSEKRIRAPYLDLKAERLVATDGYMMAMFPAKVEGSDLTAKQVPFVDYKSVITPARDSDLTVRIHVRRLLALAQSLGSDGVVEVTVPENACDPITVRVSEGGEFGLLMPCHGPLYADVEELNKIPAPLDEDDDE